MRGESLCVRGVRTAPREERESSSERRGARSCFSNTAHYKLFRQDAKSESCRERVWNGQDRNRWDYGQF